MYLIVDICVLIIRIYIYLRIRLAQIEFKCILNTYWQ